MKDTDASGPTNDAPGASLGRRDALKGITAIATSALLGGGLHAQTRAQGAAKPREGRRPPALPTGRELLLDSGWRFILGEASGAERPDYSDMTWRLLDIPHDWSIEDLPQHPEMTGESALWSDSPTRVGPFDVYRSEGQVATGWAVGGVGWYRRHLTRSEVPSGRHVEILFDGIYMNVDVWLNGVHLGNHPYGYTSFSYDLTPHLRGNAENVLAVRVNNTGRNSRWYSGSGIYRHVRLVIAGAVHIPIWGVRFDTLRTAPDSATVRLTAGVQNSGLAAETVSCRFQVVNDEGSVVASADVTRSIPAGMTDEFSTELAIAQPKLWSPQAPNLYGARVDVEAGGQISDLVTLRAGMRTVEVDAAHGLRINGESVKLKGGCLHHDNGVLGSAAIGRAEERRVELMKSNGFNAIRTSHNPPSPAFLDACDRLGMLVIDEAFDMWREAKNPQDYHLYFDEWWRRDVESMVLRDRNHPAVIFWSIGNEIPERADPAGVEIGAQLAAAIRTLDATRPITAALCSFWDHPGRKWEESAPAFANLDVGGYNYEWKNYEPDHERFPRRVMVGTESFPSEAFENWQMVLKHPFVLGDFVWTGMDYLGESGIGHVRLNGPDRPKDSETLRQYPWFNSYCGDIDLIGEKKPQSYFRDVVWGRSTLEMAVERPLPEGAKAEVSAWGWPDELRSWTWPGFEERLLKVRIYSSGDKVQLFLNGREAGLKLVSAATRLTAVFDVPYTPGELRAVALEGGKAIATLAFRTTGGPARLKLSADRQSIHRHGDDLAYVTVEVLDAAGRPVSDAVVSVDFELKGPASLVGVGSANPKEVASFHQPRRRTYHGKCLAVIRPAGTAGEIVLQAKAAGLTSASVTIRAL